jgi:ATP synthase protein I
VKNRSSKASKGELRKGDLRKYLRFSTLGIEIGVALAIGLLLGWYLDQLFGTEPWLLIFFFIFGLAAGFRNLIRLARKDWESSDNDDNNF